MPESQFSFKFTSGEGKPSFLILWRHHVVEMLLELRLKHRQRNCEETVNVKTKVDPEREISILGSFSDIPMTVRRCWLESSIELPVGEVSSS